MLSLNRAQIIGNATRDPEFRRTPSGQGVASFSVATNRVYNDANGERKETVEYHNIVTWGKLAEIAQQLVTKGRKVFVEGRLQTRRWDDKEGQKHTSVEIVANEMMMLGDRRDTNSHAQEAEISSVDNGSSMAEDEFPF